MRSDHRAVAVTGLGLVTSLGATLEASWRGLVDGRSGVKRIRRFPVAEMPLDFAATVEDFDDRAVVEQDRILAMSQTALAEALAQAGMTDRRGSRLFLAAPQPEVPWAARWRALRDGGAVAGLADPPTLRELATAADGAFVGNRLTQEFAFGAPPLTVTTACASGASAIQLAAEQIRAGRLGAAVVVGADSTVSIEGMLRFALLSALSTREGDPAGACRPFSRDRDGFVMGEGAGALVLEAVEHARARRAPVLGYVLGAGDATDVFHRTRSEPSGDPIVACMSRALQDAGVGPEEVDYINAHGTGTPENDKMEALAIGRLFGEQAGRIPVSSNKSMVGHTLSAAGAIEAIFALLTLRDGRLPPTINYETPDEAIPLDVVPNTARDAPARIALSNSFGFGGQNVSLVLGRSDLI